MAEAEEEEEEEQMLSQMRPDGAAFYDVEGREVAVFVVGAAGGAGVVDFEAWVVRMGV